MNQFAKIVGLNGQTQFVNVSNIAQIYRGFYASKPATVIMLNSGDACYVEDSPESVIESIHGNLIELKK